MLHAALGQFGDGAKFMQHAVDRAQARNDWRLAASFSLPLGHLFILLGMPENALEHANRCVEYADKSGQDRLRWPSRAALGNVLHYLGNFKGAQEQFEDAERFLCSVSGRDRFLGSAWGYWYCELLLDAARNADVVARARDGIRQNGGNSELGMGLGMLDVPLQQLALGSALVCGDKPANNQCVMEAMLHLDSAVLGLRKAGHQWILPRSLLDRARILGSQARLDLARADLDEAWEIAERGPMKLFLADIHLHRARLFFREAEYPWESPQADLAAAEKLINDCGYHRREEELADAKAAIL
jgi:tetratricopeptide (TPR) repeat protein